MDVADVVFRVGPQLDRVAPLGERNAIRGLRVKVVDAELGDARLALGDDGIVLERYKVLEKDVGPIGLEIPPAARIGFA